MTALLAPAASALWGTSDVADGLISRRLGPEATAFISPAARAERPRDRRTLRCAAPELLII
jgi:hypothetical protein